MITEDKNLILKQLQLEPIFRMHDLIERCVVYYEEFEPSKIHNLNIEIIGSNNEKLIIHSFYSLGYSDDGDRDIRYIAHNIDTGEEVVDSIGGLETESIINTFNYFDKL